MNDILHANIFFFITSVAVLAVTFMLIIVLWYVIAILREVRRVAKKVRTASESIEQDIAYVRGEVKSHTEKITSFLGAALGGFFAGAQTKKKRPSPRRRSKSETKPEESV